MGPIYLVLLCLEDLADMFGFTEPCRFGDKFWIY